MNHQGKLLASIVGHFYEGALTPESWAQGLALVTKVMACDQASIIVWDRNCDRGGMNETYGVPDVVTQEYNAYYNEIDPARGVVDQIAVGDWYIDRRDIGDFAVEHSEFYQDFMRRHDIASACSCRLLAHNGMEAYLALQRARGRDCFDAADTALLQDTIPHLQRAIRIRMQLQALAETADLASGMLDRLPSPFLVVDDGGRILMENAAAQALLTKDERLQLCVGHIARPERAKQDSQLQHLIRCACGLAGPVAAGSMSILREPERAVLTLTVMPLPPRVSSQYHAYRPLALVLIHDSAAAPQLDESLLLQLYGMTPAEARLTRLLVHGATPEQAAAQLNIGMPTIRTQLKGVFGKTGAARQADVIRILSPILLLHPQSVQRDGD